MRAYHWFPNEKEKKVEELRSALRGAKHPNEGASSGGRESNSSEKSLSGGRARQDRVVYTVKGGDGVEGLI